MFHDIDLTLTFATEAEASRFASAVELSLSSELALGPLRFTFERKIFPGAEQQGSHHLRGQGTDTRDFDRYSAEAFFADARTRVPPPRHPAACPTQPAKG